MACGSVYASESQQIGRDLTRLELTSDHHRATPPLKQKTLQPSAQNPIYNLRNGNGQEAIRFLQAEHERVLEGLHLQIQTLQQKCDDLQFEAHLRHVTAIDENSWKDQINLLNAKLEKKEGVLGEMQTKLEQTQKSADEMAEQSKWREVQLQQQIQVGEQKISELREECFALRVKVRDLKVYCAALRRGDDKSPKPESTAHSSQYDSEELLSLESEEPLSGSWREPKLTQSFQRKRRTSGVSVDKPLNHNFPLGSSLDLSGSIASSTSSQGQLSNRQHTGSGSRPGSVMLPPINLSQSVGRPQFRQHMRFSSAPPIETQQPPRARRRGSEATIQRKPKGTK